MSEIMGRCWPHGEFCIWAPIPGRDSDPDRLPLIDLSKVANSHKNSEGPDENRSTRGLKGITAYGQKMVKSAAYLLQRKHGAARLSFVTLTIPGSPEQTMAIAGEWSEIVRLFYQSLKRLLAKHGLPNYIVGCTELQPQRLRREGGCPLHLHLVFRGAHRDYQWCLKPAEIRHLWRRSIQARVPGLDDVGWASVENVKGVKSSAMGYLGKYLSKGGDELSDALDHDPELAYYLPSTWYNMTAEMRAAVKFTVVDGPSVGAILERWSLWDDDLPNPFSYSRRCWIVDSAGHRLRSFICGEVRFEWRSRLGMDLKPESIAIL